ncbi:hypothetical protein CC78DRAFT_388702 [Lojkania enalia]|uniref:Uncharacterized protein n=1 Tax=Lojkania enalia TaxID=147567 RepID=A0A9P4K1V4_9PLEO|nr:hypothetical protein CC78DRAFT_388702 [Didymosphaeria enalia]
MHPRRAIQQNPLKGAPMSSTVVLLLVLLVLLVLQRYLNSYAATIVRLPEYIHLRCTYLLFRRTFYPPPALRRCASAAAAAARTVYPAVFTPLFGARAQAQALALAGGWRSTPLCTALPAATIFSGGSSRGAVASVCSAHARSALSLPRGSLTCSAGWPAHQALRRRTRSARPALGQLRGLLFRSRSSFPPLRSTVLCPPADRG